MDKFYRERIGRRVDECMKKPGCGLLIRRVMFALTDVLKFMFGFSLSGSSSRERRKAASASPSRDRINECCTLAP